LAIAPFSQKGISTIILTKDVVNELFQKSEKTTLQEQTSLKMTFFDSLS
jgi:hypothetical protein